MQLSIKHTAHIVRIISVILSLVLTQTLPPAVAFISCIPGVAVSIDITGLLIALLLITNNHKSNSANSFPGESGEVSRQLPERTGSAASARGNCTASQL